MSNEYPARFPEGIKPRKRYTEEELETLIEFNLELIERMEKEIFEKQFTGNSDWENKEEIRLANQRLKEYRKMLKAQRPAEESYSVAAPAAAPVAAAAPAAKKPSETQNALLRMIKSMTPPKPKAAQNGKGRKTRKSKSNKKSSRKSKR